MQTLKQLLHSLGTTADEVAETCRATGVKGKSGDCHECPVARLLVLRGLHSVCVGSWDSSGTTAPLAPHMSHCPNPHPVKMFIDRFDRGCYPDLLDLFRVDATDYLRP